jgi:ribosomal protein S18 acetylase RimI-like enzyme
MPSVELTCIDSLSELQSLEEEWAALATAGGAGSLFRGPTWLIPWWYAYHQVLDAELQVYTGRADGRLVFLAPLYRRDARHGPALKVREIRLMGDAGPRPPALDLLVEPGFEERAGAALAAALAARDDEWDLIDLEPLQDPSRVRAFLASRLHAAGQRIESKHSAGGARQIGLEVAGVDLAESVPVDSLVTTYGGDTAALRKGLSLLRRLSRLEWADREENSPLADPEASALLDEVTLRLGEEGRARLARLDDSSSEAIAVALVLDDGDRAVVLSIAVDPEHARRGAAARLLEAEARAASLRNLPAMDVVTGADEYSLPPLPVTRQRALNLRVYSKSRHATLARTYGAVRRRVDRARGAQGAAAAGARAAWAKIRTTAANVASWERLHLYRGELWTRGIEHTAGLTLETLSADEFDALDQRDRAEIMEHLELDEEYCRAKWARGDLVIFSRVHGRPAGIAWCALEPVEVPELGRLLNLEPNQAYIHDVFVAPAARGRKVAPSMLEYLALELRKRDVYKSWALIGSDNLASIRAFEKAAYAPVADIVYARMGSMDRLIVRPPDPEAKLLLGLP